jgi:hypothetical protein
MHPPEEHTAGAGAGTTAALVRLAVEGERWGGLYSCRMQLPTA